MALTLIKPSVRRRLVPAVLPASTAFAVGCGVSIDAAGTGATDLKTDATNHLVKGVIKKAVASTDSDYASTKTVMVERDEDGIWEVDVGNGTADANDFGNLVDWHSDGLSVDVTASTDKSFEITKYISATKVQGRIKTWS